MQRTEDNDKAVVAELAGPRMPADHGLASLGLLMQLGGAIVLGANVIVALISVFTPGAREGTWWMFVLGSIGAVRAAFLRSAGSALSFGSPSGPFKASQLYIGIAALQTAVTLFALKKLSTSLGLDLPLTPFFFGLIAWPAALAVIISRPRVRRLVGEAMPIAEDRGFEGVSVLMTMFGVTGALLTGLVLLTMFKAGGDVLSQGPGMMLLAIGGMLFARSIVHARAGFGGLGGIADPERFSAQAARYYNFGVVSSIIAGGALLVMVMMTGFQPGALLPLGVMVYMLLAWPISLRRYFVERNFNAFLAGEKAPTFQRAPDQGLTALGWILLWFGVEALASTLPRLINDDPMNSAMGNMFGVVLGGMVDAGAAGSVWLPLGLAAAQLWAGIELVTMSDRSRLAASAYGVIGTVATLYLHWDVFKALQELGLFGVLGSDREGLPGGGLLVLIAPTMSLVIAIGSLLLANRKQTPQARIVER